VLSTTDENQRKTLDVVTDLDEIVKAVLTFVERVVPKVLACYKGEEHELRAKAIAMYLRVTISAIMPFDKFMRLMELEEMKAIDHLVEIVIDADKLDIEPNSFEALFKKDGGGAPEHIYH
jgi:hypothetical protein